jgi:hypothetical protein
LYKVIVIKGLSDTTIMIERTIKEKVELIDFAIDKSKEKLE